MKTTWIKKVGLAFVGMLVLGFVSASEPLIKVVGEKKILLKMDRVAENAVISIKELNGSNFYSESIEKSKKAYSKLFDLTTLPDGNYLVELDGTVKITTFTISIIDNKIVSADIEKTVTFKPSLREMGDRVYVSKFNPENSTLNITIFDKNNDVVYEEDLSGNLNLGRIYNFSKVRGEYKFEMSNGNKTFTQIVSIDK